MTDIGPVQLLAIGFGPEAEYRGQIFTELDRLEGKGLIRVLDLLFVGADVDTRQLVALNYQGDELGGLVGALLGFAFEGIPMAPVAVEAPQGRQSVGLTRAHVEELIREAPPGLAIGLLLIEHVWARDFEHAIGTAGGIPLADGFLAKEALADIAIELEEIARSLDEFEGEDESTPAAADGDADPRGGLVHAARAWHRTQAMPACRTISRMRRRREMFDGAVAPKPEPAPVFAASAPEPGPPAAQPGCVVELRQLV